MLGLKQQLERKGYVVLIADALEYLNLRRPLTSSELLIVAAAAFGDVASARVGKDFGKADYLSRFVEFVQRDVDLQDLKLPTGLGDLKLGIHTNQPFWIQARDRLAGSAGKLREHAHKFVGDVTGKLRRSFPKARGFVFILDSLEKIRGTTPVEFDAVVESVVEVFVKQANLLRFPCHVIYTIPPYIRQLDFGTSYDCVTDVLPAIKVHERGTTEPYGPGIEALCEVVRRRIPVAKVFGEDEALLRELVINSGGHVRLLLVFVRDVLLRGRRGGFPAEISTIQRVLQHHRERAKYSVWNEDLPILRNVLEKGDLPRLREQLSGLARSLDDHTVLCYCNGEGWYDVHPLVRDRVEQLLAREA